MNIEERAAQAAAWKATGQCNCAQAVMKAFEDKLPVDADTLMKLGAGYAVGMGCMESTCGALIGRHKGCRCASSRSSGFARCTSPTAWL